MRRIIKNPCVLFALLFVICVILTFVVILQQGNSSNNKALAGWGDNLGGRNSYTIEDINAGTLDDNIVFNSTSDGEIGNEKNFVAARLDNGSAGADNVWNNNKITVENGDIYLIQLYVNNNNPNGVNAVSQNTRVAFSIPNESSTSLAIYGYIFSDNASPSEYWDGIVFSSDNAFHFEYVDGSALLKNDDVGKNGGIQLSDNIVYKAASEHGVQIGYSSLNGEVPGGNSYAGYVSIKVMVVFDVAFTMESKVRLVGSKDWGATVDAKVGDKVEFEVQYRNTSAAKQQNVMVRDVMPKSLRYVEGTTKLWTAGASGMVLPETIATTGVNIGHFTSNSNAYIRFQAEVVEDGLACGHNTLKNWAQVGVSGVTLQDATGVYVNKDE